MDGSSASGVDVAGLPSFYGASVQAFLLTYKASHCGQTTVCFLGSLLARIRGPRRCGPNVVGLVTTNERNGGPIYGYSESVAFGTKTFSNVFRPYFGLRIKPGSRVPYHFFRTNRVPDRGLRSVIST